MPGEAELENLVVKLSGDAAEYTKALQESEHATERTAHEVEEAAHRIEGMGESLKKFGERAKETLEAFGAFEVLKTAFEGFAKAEVTTAKLTTVIQANGGAVTALLPRYREFSQSVAESTLTTKGQVVQMLLSAEEMGKSGAAAEELVSTQIALGQIMHTSAESTRRFAMNLEEGRTEILQRFVPELRNAHSESEKLSIVQKTLARGLAEAKAEVNTSEGQMHHLSTAVKMLTFQFGELVARAITPAVTGLRELIEKFTALDTETKTIVVAIGALMAGLLLIGPALTAIGVVAAVAFSPVTLAVVAVGAAIGAFVNKVGGVAAAWGMVKDAGRAAWDWLEPVRAELENLWDAIRSAGVSVWDSIKSAAVAVWGAIAGSVSVNWNKIRETITFALIAVEFYVRNFGRIWENTVTEAEFAAVRFANQVIYFFKDVVPTTIEWFAENWRDIFRDVYEFTTTVFKNLGNNIASIVKNLPGLLKGTVKWDDVWTPLTEGFKRRTKELVLPERIEGDLEKQLREEAEAQERALAESFDAFVAERTKERPVAEVLGGEEAKKDALKVGDDIGKAVSKGAGEGMKEFQSVAFGSAEALSRISEFQSKLQEQFREKIAPPKAEAPKVAAEKPASETFGKIDLEQLAVLRSIDKRLEDRDKKPSVELGPAALGTF